MHRFSDHVLARATQTACCGVWEHNCTCELDNCAGNETSNAAGQLDVRKAFDHVCHDAALRAIHKSGRRAPCVHVNLHRGSPQAAPESPVIFVMILECCARCEEKWERLEWGFWLDRKKRASASYADDNFLNSATKTRLGIHYRGRSWSYNREWDWDWEQTKHTRHPTLRNLERH